MAIKVMFPDNPVLGLMTRGEVHALVTGFCIGELKFSAEKATGTATAVFKEVREGGDVQNWCGDWGVRIEFHDGNSPTQED